MKFAILAICFGIAVFPTDAVSQDASTRPLGQDRVAISPNAAKKLGTLLEAGRPLPLTGELSKFLGDDKQEVQSTLRKVTDEHYGIIGDGEVTSIGISPQEAVAILVAIGDERTMLQLAERVKNREVNRGRDAERWLRQSGQLRMIPLLAPLLVIEEPSEGVPVPETADTEPPDRPSTTAGRLIAATLSETNEVPGTVNEWAKEMLKYEGYGRNSFRKTLIQWWKNNERSIREQKFDAIQPGPVFESISHKSADDEIAVLLDSTTAQTQNPNEREAKKQSRLAIDTLEKELAKGNFGALQSMSALKDLPILYDALQLALTHQFGDRSTEVRLEVASQIATIPGHGEYIANRVDSLSKELESTRRREKQLYLLQHVKSRETLEVLGRFLFDDRLAESGLPPENIDLNVPIATNAALATMSLSRFLGVDSPLKQQLNWYHEKEIKQMQQWWSSPQGTKYREAYGLNPTGGTTTMKPPRLTSSGELAAGTSRLESRSTWVKRSGKSVWPWVTGAALFAAVLFFGLRRRTG